MNNLYVVWFEGNGEEPSGIVFTAHQPFYATDYDAAKAYAEEMGEWYPHVKDCYVVKQLVDVEKK